MCDFKKDIAVRYGVNAAVIAQLLWDSIEGLDHSGKRVYRDRKKWCRCSILMMTGIFPFLSRHMVSDALERLIKAHVIKKDCLNSNRFDRTNWYAFTESVSYTHLDVYKRQLHSHSNTGVVFFVPETGG